MALRLLIFFCFAVYVNADVAVFCPKESELAKLCLNEFVTLSEDIFSDKIQIVNSPEKANIIFADANSEPAKKILSDNPGSVLPQGENSEQGYLIKTIADKIYIISKSDIGLLYGAYALLEEYGYYFQINGERIPEKSKFSIKHIDINTKPVFKYRGLLPWDNFLCGMSGYDLADYKLLIDRSVRLKFNMIQFHFYPGMAFFTEEWDGKKVLPTCIGMPVDTFKTKDAIGEHVFDGKEIFGPEPYVENIGDPAKQAQAVQQMMRDVIEYAHLRGVKVAVGFELMAPHGGEFSYTDKPADNDGGLNQINSLDKKNVDLSIQRYRTLVKTYPAADYYWLWQSEARGYLSRNAGKEPGAKELREKYKHWAKHENYAGDIDYAYMFKQVAEGLTAEERSKLCTGGWSVEHLFPNIDSDMPQEVIFASLNSYFPPQAKNEQVDSYRVAESGRQSWMIEWWEFDGNQWFPQFRVNWQEEMYDKCRKFGVEAVTLLGWKLTGIEHNVRYLADYSWNPELRGKEFYSQYIQKVYGAKSERLEEIFNEYDRYEPNSPPAAAADYRSMLLSAGWSSVAIPQLPNTKELLEKESWRTIIQNTINTIRWQSELLAKDVSAIEVISESMDDFDSQGKGGAAILRNRLEFRVLYLRSMLALNKGILLYDEISRIDGFENARMIAAVSYKESLDLAEEAIEKYAEAVTNKNDLGLIAQINEQFYKVIKSNYSRLTKAGTYATVDWTTFRIRPLIKFDFSKTGAWQYRDGKVELNSLKEGGQDILAIKMGGKGSVFNSAFVHMGELNLNDGPFMDFKVRTNAEQPAAFMFQVAGSEQYYAMNLMGKQNLYIEADSVNSEAINDGQWHRVTWNLLKMYQEMISAEGEPMIRNVLFGTWEAADEECEVEFKEFTIGVQNTLD